MTPDTLATRLERIRHRVAEAIARRGAGPPVTLIGVSKLQDVAAVRTAYDGGLRDFGENYVQELTEKVAAMARYEQPDDPCHWHFIGALQSNKVRQLVGKATLHTVDRTKLVSLLDQAAAVAEVVQPVLVEVNLGDEPQKGGVSPEDLPELLDQLASFPHLSCIGLMAIPPEPEGNPEAMRPYFAALAELRDRYATAEQPLTELSMGMSSDFEVAIEEGATMVRVGTAIFGPRPSR